MDYTPPRDVDEPYAKGTTNVYERVQGRSRARSSDQRQEYQKGWHETWALETVRCIDFSQQLAEQGEQFVWAQTGGATHAQPRPPGEATAKAKGDRSMPRKARTDGRDVRRCFASPVRTYGETEFLEPEFSPVKSTAAAASLKRRRWNPPVIAVQV